MHDIHHAFRTLRAAPVVSAVAILSLALGIGANTAMFSIVDSLLLRALPVKDPHQLVMVGQLPHGRTSWTNPIWEAIRDRSQPFDGSLAWFSTRFNLAQGGETQFVDGVWTSGSYFDVLGVRALLGRTWSSGDDLRGGGPDGPVAVISYSFWQRHFGGAADVIGRSLPVERVPFTIVGVTPPDFFGLDVGRTFDVAIPIGAEPLMRGRESALDRRSYWWLYIMIRLRPGQTLEAATAALRGIQPQIRDATSPLEWTESERKNFLKEPLTLDPAATGNSGLRTRYQRPLTTLMVVVGLVLLIACANIANLLLARATARRHELSVRRALGASRFRLARQLLVESLVLSGLGAALGLALAQWFSRLLVGQLSTTTNNVFLPLSLDWRMLGFTAAVAVGTAMIFGTVPALRATRAQANDALKEQGRGVVGPGRFAVGSVLVVVQVALSLMLVAGAGLFIRTFASLSKLDLGFDRSRVLVASVNTQRLQLDPTARPELFDRFRNAAAAVPGVSIASVSVTTPVSGSTWQWALYSIDGELVAGNDRGIYVNMISKDWFSTYGTRLIAGRDFTDADRRGAPDVAIVNEAYARKFLTGSNPIGRRVRETPGPKRSNPEREIVGYVVDATYRSLRDPVPPTMYIPLAQHSEPPVSASISVRSTGGSPVMLTRRVASALTAVNSEVAITLRPLADQVDAALTQERVVAMLSGFFGALALLLAGLGLYGVTSYTVSRRRTEIGIRMALGAAPGGVIGIILRRVALLVAVGIAAGTAAALWASKFIATLLFGLEPRDAVTLIVSAFVLSVTGAAAGLLPAIRAAQIDPAEVLRQG
jgi:putative ABC transport system permease protein